jgi:hypothetical protein
MILYNKVKSTFMVDGEVYKNIRILAIQKNVEVSTIIEEAMREKLEREYTPPQHYQQPAGTAREIREKIPVKATGKIVEDVDDVAKAAVESFKEGASQKQKTKAR